MKMIILLCILINYAFAIDYRPFCQNGRIEGFPHHYGQYFSHYSSLYNLNGEVIFNSDNEIKDIESRNNIWVLTENKIVQLPSFESYDLSVPAEKIVVQDQFAYLLTNTSVVKYSLSLRKVVQEFDFKTKYHSYGVDIRFYDNKIFVLTTGSSSIGLNGIIILSPDQMTSLHVADYDKSRVGVIDPQAYLSFDQSRLIINNGGWIHIVSINDVLKKKKIRPTWLPVPFGQGKDRFFMMLKGRHYIFEGNLIGCGTYSKNVGGRIEIVSDLFKIKL